MDHRPFAEIVALTGLIMLVGALPLGLAWLTRALGLLEPELQLQRRPTETRLGVIDGLEVMAFANQASTTVFVAAPGCSIKAARTLPGAASTGDHAFDADVEVTGDELELAARLDAPTRDMLRKLVAQGGEVRERTVAMALTGEVTIRTPAVLFLARVARAITEPLPDPIARLEQLVRADPRPGVRSRCFGLYLRAVRNPGRARRVARDLAIKGVGELRSVAATYLDDPALWRDFVLDNTEGDRWRAEALERLARARSPADLDAVLPQALAGPDALAVAALEVLAGAVGARWTDTLRQLVRSAWVEPDEAGAGPRTRPHLGEALARAFVAHAAPADEAALVRLALDPQDGVAEPALGGLERLGTASASAALGQAARQRGAVSGGRARRIQQVITAIRERLGDRHVGALSVAEPQAGELSVARGGGEVALAEQDEP